MSTPCQLLLFNLFLLIKVVQSENEDWRCGSQELQNQCDETSQICFIEEVGSDSLSAVCRCRDQYLPIVGNDYKCFHQNVLIGVFGGLGGAAIVILIGGFVVRFVGCKRMKFKGRLIETGDGLLEPADEALDSAMYGHPGLDHDGSEEASSLDKDSVDSVFTESPPARVGLDTLDQETEAPGLNSDDVYTAAHKNWSHSFEESAEDETAPAADPEMTRIMTSDAFRNFEVQLDKIDTDKDYFADRPVIKLPTDDICQSLESVEGEVMPEVMSEAEPEMTRIMTTDAYKNFEAQLDKIDPEMDYFANRPVITLSPDDLRRSLYC